MNDARIFVFGSNLAGRHGKGAARYALINCGAIYGQGIGRQGMSYAIPTKDAQMQVLPLERILAHVNSFRAYAFAHPLAHFQVTAIGCGLAGYRPEDIAPMFADCPTNCFLPHEFRAVLDRAGRSVWA